MSSSSPTGKNTAEKFGDWPEPIAAFLSLLERNAFNDVGAQLAQFLASFVHPDFVCNLALMNKLPDDVKAASMAMFDYCLKEGLSAEQLGQLYQLVEPYLLAAPFGSLPKH